MSFHAGFAAAVTIRENVLQTALLAAYANGSFPTALNGDLPAGPPSIKSALFLGQPIVNLEASANLITLTLNAWGQLTVTAEDNTEQLVQINGSLILTIKPVFTREDNTTVKLVPDNEDINVTNWSATVTSPDTPAATISYLTGDNFRLRLQQVLRLAIAFQQFKLPTLDISFFGPLVAHTTNVAAIIRPGALMLGLDIVDEENQVNIIGDVNQLTDFASTNDIGGVVNANAVGFMLEDVQKELNDQITAEGASLEGFTIQPKSGYFRVSGRASKTGGAVNFSFHLIPGMFHTRPGKYFNYLPKPRRVNSRTWPGLEFRIEAVETDADRSWWAVILEIFAGALSFGWGALVIDRLFTSAAESFSGKLNNAPARFKANRIQHTIPPPGGVAVRIALEHFDTSTDGIFIGILVTHKVLSIVMGGPIKLPADYAGEMLHYTVQLPSATFLADPALMLQWTIEDQTNATVLSNIDGPAQGRLTTSLLPAVHPTTTSFSITARLYRKTGTLITELGTTRTNLQLRGPLAPKAYIRWRSEVSNPQIALDPQTDQWSYRGEVRVRRWSEWHRTDQPCRAVNAANRYRFEIETADRLPFPLRLLDSHKKGLCPYCFYKGPAGINAIL